MRLSCVLILALTALLQTGLHAAGGWQVVDTCWRPDENPGAKTQVWDDFIWAEGWSEPEQFWPKFFKPAGSLHVVLRNTSDTAGKLSLTEVDGKKLAEVITTPDQAGRVIWRRILPEETRPGGWAECIIRLRKTPVADVRLTFEAGTQKVDVAVPAKPKPARIESISYSPDTDKVYVYVRSIGGGEPKPGAVRLDGAGPASCRWSPGPKGSGLLLAEAKLKSPLEWGSYHLLEVQLGDGTLLARSTRAWDSYFAIGLFGTIDEARIKEAIERGFNTYVIGTESKLLDDLGINYVVRWGIGEGRKRTRQQSGTLFNNNLDEPDANDWSAGKKLPFTDRLGVSAELEVLPSFRDHLSLDPHSPSMVLVDGTYKPLNWYVYGQTADVFCTDPYVPLGGSQVDYVAHAMECARDASAPCPVIATLWCTCMHQPEKSDSFHRPPTPEEERMMTFYALGAGVKGVFYFADRDTPTSEDLISVVHNKPLWDEMGRINKDVAVLAPYLANGCPAGVPVETKSAWVRSLMCGPDKMVLIAINKGHYIAYNTQHGFAWHWAAKDVKVSAPLPARFKKCRVEEVKGGKLVPAAAEVARGAVSINLDVLDTARAFVISRAANE